MGIAILVAASISVIPFVLGMTIFGKILESDFMSRIIDHGDGDALYLSASKALDARLPSAVDRYTTPRDIELLQEGYSNKKKFVHFVAHCHALGLTVNFEPLDYQPEQPDGLDTQIVLR